MLSVLLPSQPARAVWIEISETVNTGTEEESQPARDVYLSEGLRDKKHC